MENNKSNNGCMYAAPLATGTGGVVMMAKKRRRRRVDGTKPAAGTPPKTAPAASSGAKQEKKDADEDGDDGVALPPMPSELGLGAVMAAQVGARVNIAENPCVSAVLLQPGSRPRAASFRRGVGVRCAGCSCVVTRACVYSLVSSSWSAVRCATV